MKVIYNITDRKPFVKALEEITGAKAVYMKTPTYAYTVDYFTVTREGNLTFNDMADSEEIERVLEELDRRGFHCESSEYDEPQQETGCEEPLEDCPPAYGVPETKPQDETVGLSYKTIRNGHWQAYLPMTAYPARTQKSVMSSIV